MNTVLKPLFLSLLLSAGAAHDVSAGTEYVEGDVIITFKPGTTTEKAKGVIKGKSMTFSRHFHSLSAKRGKTTGLVKHGSKTTSQLMAELKNDPAVENVEPNYLRWVRSVPNDTRFAEMWALRNTGQTVDGTAGTRGADISFTSARDMARTASGEVVVGVVDTGVDWIHPDLTVNIWTNPQETPGNLVDDDGNGYVDDVHGYDFTSSDADPSDSGEHGTHVAGTIAALGGNAQGVIGVNDHAKILPLKVSSNGSSITSSAVIEALEYATALKNHGVNIVALNGSYGGGGYSNAEVAAIQDAGAAGILFCVAAGNESTDNDDTPTYPASYHLSNMIVVAATDQKDELASYSNYGATSVDIAAPGTNILSTKPSTVSFQADGVTYAATALTFSGVTPGVTGTLVDCGIGNTGEFPASVSGNIALIQRGTLTFSEKVTNAMNAGAKAAIIYNNVPGAFGGTLQTAGNWIPAYSISQANGQTIKSGLPMTGGIVVTGAYQFEDGTSMATPHVAGAVAFAAMNQPSETLAQRRQRVLAGVDLKSALSGKVATGGRLNLLRIADSDRNGISDWQDDLNSAEPIITTSSPLDFGIAGTAYSLKLAGSRGTSPYTYSLATGNLPPGLALATNGQISGTPTTAGTYTFDITIHDTKNHSSTSTLSMTVVTRPEITIASPITSGTIGSAYSFTFSATGGTSGYTWSVKNSSTPPGLSLSSSGVLSGLPTESGTYAFTVEVTDALAVTDSLDVEMAVLGSPISILTPSALPYAMISEPYATQLEATGGTQPYAWQISSGTLPQGLSLISSTGALTGTPVSGGIYSLQVRVSDTGGHTVIRYFTLEVRTSYVVPVVARETLGSITAGVPYSHTFTAANYPKKFTITGLPRGLTYVTATGVVSGRPLVASGFQIKVTATNPAGTSSPVIMPLTVTTHPAGAVGSFMGLIARDATTNAGLGSRISLTTTALGAYTLKITTGATTKNATGYLEAAAPHINTSIAGAPLIINIDSTSQTISGTHGSALVTGWRSTWNASIRPATTRAGYYSIGIDLADPAVTGLVNIPQGSGYAAFTIAKSGALTLAGRTSEGQALTSGGFMGPDGQLALHTSLYSNKGSVSGILTLTDDINGVMAQNTASGKLTWNKPAITGRTYAAGFSELNLIAYGKYLAPNSTTTIQGLPTAGTAKLSFTDGGLHLAAIDPDIGSFTYGSNYTITLPTYASGSNPARTTLKINKNTGAVSGTFTLVDPAPTLTRTVSFSGQIVRPASGTRLATGYFLLPQIPITGETKSTSAILSGGVRVSQ